MEIINLIQDYGFESVLIAIIVCIMTGLIKMPIKSLAAKTKDSSRYTKYITFLPLIIGFGVVALYEYVILKSVTITAEYITLWLTSSSLSLAIYAFIEKFIPSKKKILSAEEIRQNQEMLDEIKKNLSVDRLTEPMVEQVPGSIETKVISESIPVMAEECIETEKKDAPVQTKIILQGKKND